MSLKSTREWKHIAVTSVALAVLGAPSVEAQSGDEAVVYTYDALGRVTSASYDNNTTITYAYDAAGNRVQQAVTIGSPPSSSPAPGLLPSGPPGGPWLASGNNIYYNGGNTLLYIERRRRTCFKTETDEFVLTQNTGYRSCRIRGQLGPWKLRDWRHNCRPMALCHQRCRQRRRRHTDSASAFPDRQ